VVRSRRHARAWVAAVAWIRGATAALVWISPAAGQELAGGEGGRGSALGRERRRAGGGACREARDLRPARSEEERERARGETEREADRDEGGGERGRQRYFHRCTVTWVVRWRS